MIDNKYIMLDKSIMIASNECPQGINNTHPNFKEIKEQLENDNINLIMNMYKNGGNATFLVNFLNQAVANPNPNILEEIDTFLLSGNIPIKKNGCLLVYKAVDINYKDIHTVVVNNAVIIVESAKIIRIPPTSTPSKITAQNASKAHTLDNKWTITETNALVRLKERGITYAKIGKILGRSGNACRKRYNLSQFTERTPMLR